MMARKIFAAAGLACLSIVVLAGCRSEEQGRITRYQPGVYKGTPDQHLTEEQQRTLRLRAIMQSGAVGTGGGGTPRDVRKPALDSDTLNQRARNQKGS